MQGPVEGFEIPVPGTECKIRIDVGDCEWKLYRWQCETEQDCHEHDGELPSVAWRACNEPITLAVVPNSCFLVTTNPCVDLGVEVWWEHDDPGPNGNTYIMTFCKCCQ